MEFNFSTPVDIEKYPFGISYSNPTLLIGSCFADNIGNMMLERKFQVITNPFGVVYNPISAALVLNRIIDGKPYCEDELGYHNSRWFSFHHHTSFSSHEKLECLNAINLSLKEAHDFWKKTDYLVVTFGTARVYHHKKLRIPVANCHKIPAREFTHSLQTVDEITAIWKELIDEIQRKKDGLKIILTVSPIRHWKDGPTGNQISKSTLILAVSQLLKLFPDKVFYFPSYEIMMDELRDYRFYADDMLHLSSLSVDYIWNKFREATITVDAQKVLSKVEIILAAVKHQPFNPKSKDFIAFAKGTLDKIDEVKKENLILDFTNEVKTLKGYLSK